VIRHQNTITKGGTWRYLVRECRKRKQEGMNLDQEMTVKLLGKGDKKQVANLINEEVIFENPS